jgi:hypothetical protein
VKLSQLLVPGGLVFLFSIGVLWVWTIARTAAVKRRQQERLVALNAPKKGENHVSLTDRVYRLNPPHNPDAKQRALWQQWVDLQQVSGAIASTK